MHDQNRHFRNIAQGAFFILVTTVLSCHKKDPVPDCGCDAVKFENIENVRASYNGQGIFSIFPTSDTIPSSAVISCNIDTSWQRSKNYKMADYTISGNVKSSCFTGETFMAVPPNIDITSIKRD